MSLVEPFSRAQAPTLSGPWGHTALSSPVPLLLGRGLLPCIPVGTWDEQPVEIQVHLYINGGTSQFCKSLGIQNQQKRQLLGIGRDNG